MIVDASDDGGAITVWHPAAPVFDPVARRIGASGTEMWTWSPPKAPVNASLRGIAAVALGDGGAAIAVRNAAKLAADVEIARLGATGQLQWQTTMYKLAPQAARVALADAATEIAMVVTFESPSAPAMWVRKVTLSGELTPGVPVLGKWCKAAPQIAISTSGAIAATCAVGSAAGGTQVRTVLLGAQAASIVDTVHATLPSAVPTALAFHPQGDAILAVARSSPYGTWPPTVDHELWILQEDGSVGAKVPLAMKLVSLRDEGSTVRGVGHASQPSPGLYWAVTVSAAGKVEPLFEANNAALTWTLHQAVAAVGQPAFWAAYVLPTGDYTIARVGSCP
ncbi:MAG: hypothetical protein FJ100_23205 [Deltaproteobacteria bacterium]|nr:hypothetical protein [Deltaproteobacteria bacterium]